MTEQEIAKLRALIENATPLPWEVVFEPGKHIVIGSRTGHTGVCIIFNDVHDLEYKQDNAVMIVAAVNTIPALLDEVENARKLKSVVMALLEYCKHNTLSFQREKLEDYLNELRSALGKDE